MTYKQLETARETRLWLTQIVLPIVTVVMLVPESRKVVIENAKKAKTNIKNYFSK